MTVVFLISNTRALIKDVRTMPDDKYINILREHWGYDSFRGVQREIIGSIGSGKDTLGLMPTGGGKSITFQVPALALQGVCLVITPLIALMKDQVANLRRRGIKAAAIYGTMPHGDIIKTLENAIFGGVKILYVSPERLSSELFQTKLRHMKVSFITVDEAHCISQWGYDFRPSYLNIADIRKNKPGVPILALTATATPKVINDIQDKLLFKEKNVFRMSFERKNLAYIVRRCPDKLEEIQHILKSVRGSAIIYVRSRQRSKDVAKLLNKAQISATFYNAGLDGAIRDDRQKEWTEGKIRVMVATNAFGMGIDKPDVRLVIHIDCPDSIEAYFQEAGRAGRDGLKSYAVLLYNNSDKAKLARRIEENYPPKDYIRKVYEDIAGFKQVGVGSGGGYRFEFNIDLFCRYFKHFPVRVNSALHILTRAGYIEYEDESDNRAQVRMLLERNDLDRLDSLNRYENAVITALMRNYGALFVDYCYIDEALIAVQSDLSVPEVYAVLKALTERRILQFIPRKKIPHITYTQHREEKELLMFPPEVYDQRKKELEDRINAMLNYAETDFVCRSRHLLLYFGEESKHDCGQCDVCIEKRKKDYPDRLFKQACDAIKELLSDKQEHITTDIFNIPMQRSLVEEAMEYLIKEGQIQVADGMLRL